MTYIREEVSGISPFYKFVLPCIVDSVDEILLCDKNYTEDRQIKRARCLNALSPTGLAYIFEYLRTRSNLNLAKNVREKVDVIEFKE
jgi:hypothetical protein